MIMTVTQIAKLFKKNPSTIRRWVEAGCPSQKLGGVGRGRGSQLDPEQVAKWRVAQCVPTVATRAEDDSLAMVETALLDCWRRDDLAQRIKTTEPQAALALLIIFERFYKNLKQQPLEPQHVPEQLRHLCAIALDSVEAGKFQRR